MYNEGLSPNRQKDPLVQGHHFSRFSVSASSASCTVTMVFCPVYKAAKLLAGHSPMWTSFWTVQPSGKVLLSHQVK